MSMKKFLNISLGRKRVLLILIMLAILFIFPQKAVAAEKSITIYYYDKDYLGDGTFSVKEIDISDLETDEQQKAEYIFRELFRENENSLFPNKVELIDCKIKDNTLILDISNNILEYGGTDFELDFIKLLAQNAYDLNNIKYMTILIEGEEKPLAEGNIIVEKSIEEISLSNCNY